MDVTNKKGIGITSLETLAYNVEEDGMICSIIDARNDNVYYGIFEKKENKTLKCDEQDFSSIDELLEKIKGINQRIFFVGSGAIVHKKRIIEQLKENIKFVENENLNKLNARNIATATFYNKENSGDSNTIIPTYLRKSNAER